MFFILFLFFIYSVLFSLLFFTYFPYFGPVLAVIKCFINKVGWDRVKKEGINKGGVINIWSIY